MRCRGGEIVRIKVIGNGTTLPENIVIQSDVYRGK